MNVSDTIFTPPPHLIAIHGWGFHGAVWEDTGRQLRALGYGFTAVDLPGFGACPTLEGEYTLSALADSVLQALPPGKNASLPVLLGWSLGGLTALEMIRRYPERFRALVMVAAAPRFTKADDWPHGVDPAVLEGFSQTLTEDYRSALTRFLLLQAGRTDSGRATVKKLKPLLFRHGIPDGKALEQGLALLRETDHREVLGSVRHPVLFVLGARDNLLSCAAAQDLRALCPHARAAVIPGSAHAPFISHPAEFMAVLTEFLGEVFPKL